MRCPVGERGSGSVCCSPGSENGGYPGAFWLFRIALGSFIRALHPGSLSCSSCGGSVVFLTFPGVQAGQGASSALAPPCSELRGFIWCPRRDPAAQCHEGFGFCCLSCRACAFPVRGGSISALEERSFLRGFGFGVGTGHAGDKMVHLNALQPLALRNPAWNPC